MDAEPEQANRRWTQLVLDHARSILDAAMEEAPIPIARYYRALSAADGLFWGSARKHLPALQQEEAAQ